MTKSLTTKIAAFLLTAILAVSMAQFTFAGEGESEGGE